jgi:predicted RNA-binding Zn-ribbon protein involved in translation (DUF1610 family)
MTELEPNEMICPRCGGVARCDSLPTSFGDVQGSPYECGDCGWTEPSEEDTQQHV